MYLNLSCRGCQLGVHKEKLPAYLHSVTLSLCGHSLHHFYFTHTSSVCVLCIPTFPFVLHFWFWFTHIELLLFLCIVLNSPNVPDLITGSLNLVRTVPKKLHIIAVHGISGPTHFWNYFLRTLLATDSHFSYTHSSGGYTLYVPTHSMNDLFVYLPFTCVNT